MKTRTLAIVQGEHEPTGGGSWLWFISIEDFAMVLSGRNGELLETIAREGPSSTTKLAELAGHNTSSLSQTRTTMSGYGLVELRKPRAAP